MDRTAAIVAVQHGDQTALIAVGKYARDLAWPAAPRRALAAFFADPDLLPAGRRPTRGHDADLLESGRRLRG
jgi:hypothetical protein